MIKKLFIALLMFPLLASAASTVVPWERTFNTGNSQGTTSPLFLLDEARFNTFRASSTSATSTIAGGLSITGGGLKVSTLLNCNTVDTDGSGVFICGTDATGAGGSSDYDAWSHPTNFGVLNSATTTPLWLRHLTASSSVAFSLDIGTALGVGSTATTTILGNLATSTFSGGLITTSLKASGLEVTGGNVILPNSSVSNAELANSSFTVTTAAPLGGAATISLGDTLALTCTGCVTSIPNYDAFTHVVTGTSATSTEMRFTGGFISNASSTVASTLTVTGGVIGNASTATALAANGANCNAGEYPLGVNASGAVESCTDATTEINSAIAGITFPDAFTHPVAGESATTTILNMAGFNTTGSSTINSTLQIGSNIIPITNGGATLGNAAKAFSSLTLKDTTSAYGGTIQFTNTSAGAWQILTLDIGNYSPTLTFQGAAGNPTLGDWFNQSVKTTAQPTFAGLIATASTTIGGLFNVSGRANINASSTATSTFAGGIAVNSIGGLSSASGLTITGGSINCSACIPNASLANSGISGTDLGGTLQELSPGATLSGTAYDGSTNITDWNINLANSNSWTASTTFSGLVALSGGIVVNNGTVTFPASFGGRSLTMNGTAIDADAELFTRTISFNVASSSLGTSTQVASYQFPSNATITEVNCSTNNGRAEIQLEKRPSNQPNASSTFMLQSYLACTMTTASTTSFAVSAINGGNDLALQITRSGATSSAPTLLRAHVKYTLND